jgi:putative membrane protein
MFCALIFIIIIQAIWFSFRDKAFASIIIVIFLILNLAAGGGTFPAILQNDFFHAISYILPFTYVIHGQSAIIYGIGTGTNAIENCLYVLKMCGVMLIFAAVFLTLGLCTCGYRLKEINYGTANKYKLAKVLMSLNNKKYNEFIETNRRGKKYANFKKLPNEQNKEIYEKTMELYPLEVKFKRFRKDDFVEMDSAILE